MFIPTGLAPNCKRVMEFQFFKLAQFAGSRVLLLRPSKTGTFLKSLHGCIHGVSQEEYPATGESLVDTEKPVPTDRGFFWL